MTDLFANSQGLITAYLIPFAWKLVGAVAMWIIGGWVINMIGNLSRKGMVARKVDPTLITYAEASIRVALRIALVVAILGVFGIETTSFAAFIAAAGIAIGAAWSGLLSNFAAGVFMVILRPFKVGDMITAGGVTGDVREIGLFATTLDTVDNLRVVVGNNKIFADNIINYSHNECRRVDLKAQIGHSVNPMEAIALLKAKVAQIPNVAAKPEPSVEILEFNPAGCVIAVRPYCHNADYWQVYFDTNKAIQDVGAAAGWPIPAPHQVLLQKG